MGSLVCRGQIPTSVGAEILLRVTLLGYCRKSLGNVMNEAHFVSSLLSTLLGSILFPAGVEIN